MEKEQQYKVIISPHAFKMLDRQVRFVAEISAVSANKLRKQVISEIRTLRKMPERYPVIDDPNITACLIECCMYQNGLWCSIILSMMRYGLTT